MSNQENMKQIAYDAFVYAYPMLEQVKTINGMMEFMGVGFNRAKFGPTFSQGKVGTLSDRNGIDNQLSINPRECGHAVFQN